MKKLLILTDCLLVAGGMWAAPRLVATNNYGGIKVVVNYDPAKTGSYTLEDPLTFADGRKVKSAADWPARRAELLQIFAKEMYGVEPKVEALHAGLECGILASKLEGLDCVSFGPNIHDIHTTEERLEIGSTKRCWEYILELLKHL